MARRGIMISLRTSADEARKSGNLLPDGWWADENVGYSFVGTQDDDNIYSGHGDSTMFGGDGDDRLFGWGGNDILKGGKGNDTLYGGAGDDRMKGGRGDDTLYGVDGNDILKGGKGDDTLDGSDGDDLLLGGAGNDDLDGGDGDDTLYGGKGNEWLNGGAGADRFVFNGKNSGHDYIRFYEDDEDTIVFTGGIQFSDLIITDRYTDFSGPHPHFHPTQIEDASGEWVIKIEGVRAADLTESDFEFLV